MDLPFLQSVCAELNDRLTGSFINKVHQPLPREIVLSLWGPRPGPGQRLVVSADPRWGRLHLTVMKIPNPPTPPRFCSYLRAHLQGGTIHAVECAADDRVVNISASLNTASGRVGRVLILELLGRDSNIILTDMETGLIKDCLHQLHEGEGKTRAVSPGRVYEPPPPKPATADVAPPDRSTGDLMPAIVNRADGGRVLGLFPVSGCGDVFATANEAADAFYRPRLGGDLREAYRRELLRPLAARIRSLKTRVGKIRQDIVRLETMALRREDGDLLKANLSTIRKGMKEIEAEDFFRGGRRVIKLDPALGPITNMERCFRHAAKGKRGAGITQERLRISIEEQSAVEDLAYFIETADSIESLERLAEEIPSFKPIKKSPPQPKKRLEKTKGAPPVYSFTSPSGIAVLVGRSAAGNDHLVRRKAKKGDVWLHVEGRAGAHVLILRGGAGETAPEDVAYAASLAVYFSKARGKGPTEVIVADAGDVTSVRGGPPGRVTVQRHRTVRVESPPHVQVPGF